jgi:phenylacetate-coenzyme A ligase PaaK-like adenylate-forming protein
MRTGWQPDGPKEARAALEPAPVRLDNASDNAFTLAQRMDTVSPATSRALEEAQLARWRLRPGNPSGSIFAQLVTNEFAPPHAITAFQDWKLAAVLALAFERVPYYRDQLSALGLEAGMVRQRSDLPRLPILSKQDVIDNFDTLQAQGLPVEDQPAVLVQSSGTTGRPVKVAMTRTSDAMFGFLAHRRRRWARLDPMGTVCTIKIPSHFPRTNGALLPNGEVFRSARWLALGAHFATGPTFGFNVWNPVEQQLVWLKEIHPDYLETYSSTMEELAFANDCASPAASITALFSSALSTAPSTRRQVERIYGAPLHDAYGLELSHPCRALPGRGGRRRRCAVRAGPDGPPGGDGLAEPGNAAAAL